MPDAKLPLHRLHERHYGLTVGISQAYEEAAAVCLQRHHRSPVQIAVSNGASITDAIAEWTEPDHRTLAGWANDTDATEAGAYACALACVELTRGFTAVRRAETESGADYYVGPTGSGIEDLEDCLRLEVSGIDAGGSGEIQRRIAAKVRQVKSGSGSLPALAGVVAFKERVVVIADVTDEP